MVEGDEKFKDCFFVFDSVMMVVRVMYLWQGRENGKSIWTSM